MLYEKEGQIVKISLVIPIYNSAKYLKRTLDSVVRQTIFNDIEVILVNDGSTDKSENICLEFANKYKNIFLVNKPNGGVSQARNYGIKYARCKYICFMDSDDTIKEDLYEHLYWEITSQKSDLVCINTAFWFPDDKVKNKNKKIHAKYKKNNEILKKFFMGGKISNLVCDKIFLTNIVKEIKFKEDKKIGEDMYFVYEYLKRINSVILDYKYVGYNYYKNTDSAMHGLFSQKYYDTIILSNLMVNDYRKDDELYKYAAAHYIHETCKVLEYIIISENAQDYQKEKKELYMELNKYSLLNALRYMQLRKFCGFLLMRCSERLYKYFYIKMRIG